MLPERRTAGTTSPSVHRAAGMGVGALVETRWLLRVVVRAGGGGGEIPQGAVALCGGSGISCEVKMSPGESGQREGLKDWCSLGGAEGPSAGLGAVVLGRELLQGAASGGDGLMPSQNVCVLSKASSSLFLQLVHHEDAIPAPYSAVPLACAAGAWR